MARLLLVLLCLAGCRRANPDYCDPQTACAAPLVCDQTARECVTPGLADLSVSPILDLSGDAQAPADLLIRDLSAPADLVPASDLSACTMTTCTNNGAGNALCRMACGTLTAKCQNNKCQP